MINGLFYPEGQSPAEKAAAAKKKTPFVAKGMFVASPNSDLSSSNSPYLFFSSFCRRSSTNFCVFTEPHREYFPISPSWELSEYELTGAWNNLPSAERTPPAALRLARLAEANPSSITYAERLELETARATQNSVGDQGLFGAGGGQEALNYNVVPVQPGQQYNSFGAPLAGSAASGGSTGQAGGHVDVRDNHGDHMSRSEMAVVRAFFDEIMKPGKQRQTWE